MKTSFKNRAVLLLDIKPGEIFGQMCGTRYCRFLKTSIPMPNNSISCVCIGPYLKNQPKVSACIMEADELAIIEENTEIHPKVTASNLERIEPKSPRECQPGSIHIAHDGRLLLYVQDNHGRVAFIDLATGEKLPLEFNIVAAAYSDYVLIGTDELGKKTVIFDSSSPAPTAQLKLA